MATNEGEKFRKKEMDNSVKGCNAVIINFFLIFNQIFNEIFSVTKIVLTPSIRQKLHCKGQKINLK